MARDRYKYFLIEGRELFERLSQEALALRRAPQEGASVGRILRMAHTLKGAAGVVQAAGIASAAHEIEDALSPHREAAAPVPAALVKRVQALLERIGDELASLEASRKPAGEAPAPAPAAAAAVPGPLPATLRIELQDLDRLGGGIARVETGFGAAEQSRQRVVQARADALQVERAVAPFLEDAGKRPGEADRERLRVAVDRLLTDVRDAVDSLGESLDRTRRDVLEVRTVIGELRLVPVGATFPSLEQAARDAASSLGKEVEVATSGGEIRVDTHVLHALAGALTHLVRNAVDHGIEAAPERRASGKPDAGRLRIEVERRGFRVALTVADDGRGIQTDEIRRIVVRQGSLPREEAERLDAEGLHALLLRGDLTTKSAATALSGRGLGLGAVREIVSGVRGSVRLHSTAGVGTRVELLVPVSLASLRVLEVAADGIVAAFPAEAVRAVLAVGDDRLVRSAVGAAIPHEGSAIPYAPLTRLFGRGAPPGAQGGLRLAVVVGEGAERAAFGIETTRGFREVTLRPPPASAGPTPLILGVARDGSGAPLLVLDPRTVAERLRGLTDSPATQVRRERPLALVIDDSLTTRMLLEGVLQASGFEVDLQGSAEDGLRRARERPPAVILVDVELPGMSGFEFVEQVQADAGLRQLPVVLVTTRGSPEDRRRGMEAGARGYVVKEAFDERSFLSLVRGLLG